MADSIDNPTEDFLDTFDKGEARPPHPVLPLQPPKAFYKLHRSVFGLTDFPPQVFLQAFREVFRDFGPWRYDDEDKVTNIYIHDQMPDMAKGEQQRYATKPGVITQRGPISPSNTDGRQRQKRLAIDRSFTQFSERLVMPMTVHCLSKNGPEAEHIACGVFAILMVAEDVFKRRGIHAILDPTIQPEQPMYESGEYDLINVPVTYRVEYTWSWARLAWGWVPLGIACLDVTAS